MMKNKQYLRKAIAIVLIVGTSCMINACGASDDNPKNDAASSSSSQHKGSENETSSDPSQTPSDEKIASSIQSLISQTLDRKDLSSEQRTILQDARQSGSISISQYEQAWSNYKQCMVDHGHTHIILQKFSNGVYAEASYKQSTDKGKEQKYIDDREQCSNTYVDFIDNIYKTQVGNQNLYSNQASGIVDCFHRENLVPKSYTAKDFDKEQSKKNETNGKSKMSFDEKDPQIRGCMVANNYMVGFPDDPVESID